MPEPKHFEDENNPEILFSGNHWELPTDPKLLDGADDLILNRLIRAGWDEETATDIMLGFHEALLNAMKHGNGQQHGSKVTVDMQIAANEVRFEIEDQGPGFDWRNEPSYDDLATHGRGMKHYIKPHFEVTYNEPGNKITLVKKKQL